jgi:formylglycine-generating enzyme required for sulfatase activity
MKTAFVLLFCLASATFPLTGLLADTPAQAPTYEQLLGQGNGELKAGKLDEAMADAKQAIAADGTRFEAYALAAMIAHKEGHDDDAKGFLDKAQAAVPADKKAKLDALAQQILGADSVAVTILPDTNEKALSGADRREYNELMLIMDDADRAKLQDERKQRLSEFLTQSTPFVKDHPNITPVWAARAIAALETDNLAAGRDAGRNMLRLDADDSNDPRTTKVMALLGRRDWLAGLEIPKPGKPCSVFLADGVTLTLMPISAGTFTMGSPADEPGRRPDEIQHQVVISKPFWLGRTDVTHGQWKAVMGTDLVAQDRLANPGIEPPNHHGSTDDNEPMYFVSWDEAMAFCQKVNELARASGALPDGYAYTLPTEAQWEYACRAGTNTATYAGPIQIMGKMNAPVLAAIAWYGGNSSVGYQGIGWDTTAWPEKEYPGGNAGPRDVGLKQPNAWGLYDMEGDVFQWCRDWYGSYQGGVVADPVGPISGSFRVLRGGSWGSTAVDCRSANRGGNEPGFRNFSLGFRLALSSVP